MKDDISAFDAPVRIRKLSNSLALNAYSQIETSSSRSQQKKQTQSTPSSGCFLKFRTKLSKMVRMVQIQDYHYKK